MSVRRLYEDQPASFAFTPENREWAEGQLRKYPRGREASAVIPLLWRAQEQHGWLPEPAIRHVAEMLNMKPIRVLEVATFYTMFNLKPVGKHFVQVCGNISCLLRGAEELMKTCEDEIGPRDTVNEDLDMSWTEVECAGACTNAPVVAIGNDYIEDLTGDRLAQIIAKLRNGEKIRPGPQNGRFSSEPEGGATSLLDKAAIFEAWKAYSPKLDDEEGETKEDEKAEPTLLADDHKEPELIADDHEEPVLVTDKSKPAELV
ncbi:MAG TPA: NADH-quinone oxidoreductase subunit NuoE, partial [Rhizobiales bacterium]|nr:NADH-quinone oxidoreductase subunit NuoE [Hyphomicrobiales bacterium]